jgi:acetyltransferase-like isoleucine patch superfamily enzyme
MDIAQYKKDQNKRRLILMIFGSKFFDFPLTFRLRIKAFQKNFNIGQNPVIQNNVQLFRTHRLDGKISIGDRVLLARNVLIDYSGDVIIEDDVWLSEGSEIHSHLHRLDSTRLSRSRESIVSRCVVLRRACWIGARAIILPQSEEIGENSIVAAGAIVTRKVPANVMVAGNPARIIKQIRVTG